MIESLSENTCTSLMLRQRTIYKVRAVKAGIPTQQVAHFDRFFGVQWSCQDGIEGYVVTSGEVKPWNPCYKVSWRAFGDDFCGLRRQVGRYQQKNVRSLHHFIIYKVIIAL